MTPRTLLYLVLAGLSAAGGAEAQPARKTVKVRPTEVSTDHLKVRHSSEVQLLAGDTVSLELEIEPRPGMHVYAPGADDYQVITITLAEHPDVRPRPVIYPPSETYVFAPLNERIPVYQKPFRLAMDAVVGMKIDVLKGRLDYQACDDKVCFAPVEVPLSWVISR